MRDVAALERAYRKARDDLSWTESEGVAAMRELGRTELAAARVYLHRRVDEVRADLGLPSRRRAAFLGFVEAVQAQAENIKRAFDTATKALAVTVVSTSGHPVTINQDACGCGWPSAEQRATGETFHEHMVRDVLGYPPVKAGCPSCGTNPRRPQNCSIHACH